MKNSWSRISLYWKLQLLAWSIYFFVTYMSMLLNRTSSTMKVLYSNPSLYTKIWGLLALLLLVSTHFIRVIEKKIRIFSKPLKTQVLFFLVSISLFSFILPLVQWFIGQKLGFQSEYLAKLRPWEVIIKGYFTSGLYLTCWIVVYFLYRYFQESKTQSFLRIDNEKKMVELEAKALRAQMNPHFVFNSLNSIKSLIQQDEKDKSVTYLTIFSKLIRTLFNNADKKEISLYDEIETCKLYLQLEAMRFDTKFSFAVNIADNIDLKSIQVPALIIQPFIENAIWHGIVPRNTGGNVSLNVQRKDESIEIVIDDNGIGREASAQNKSASQLTHKSKGVNLTQSRLELDNLLQHRQAKLEIIDKKHEKGMATGTKVIITIKEEV